MPVGLGIGIAGVAGAGASIYGAQAGESAESNAAKTAESMQGPYVNAGKTAIGQIDNPNTLMQNYQQSPGYQWGLQQGENAVTTNSAMNGLLRSGGAAKALDTYATGAADQDFNNWFGQEESLANMGQNSATNVSNILLGQGKNAANADVATANAAGSAIGSMAGMASNPATAQLLNPVAGGASSYSEGTTGANGSGQVAPFLYGGS